MTAAVPKATGEVLQEVQRCPLCGSSERQAHSQAKPNLYSEKLVALTGIDESELIECMPNSSCDSCGLIYKRRWFPRSHLEALFRDAVPWHPKGWDAISDRFSADNFFSELDHYEDALRSGDPEQSARWQRSLLSIIDSIPELEDHPDRPAIQRAIQSGDCATVRQYREVLYEQMSEPAPFKRFAGFRSCEMWHWCIERAGPVETYAEVGCPLWGMLPIARGEGTRAIFLSRPEPNYWGSNCRMDGRGCTAEIQRQTGTEHAQWDAVAPGEFDMIGLFQYLDHLEDPLDFMDALFTRARACALILDHFSQPTAIQHFTGWTPRAIEWLADRFDKRGDDGSRATGFTYCTETMTVERASIESDPTSATAVGEQMHALARRLWPINRSISGAGLRQTLHILQVLLPKLRLIEVPSGSPVLDWIVPEEWDIREAWLEGPDGERIVDFADNNLHVVGYSEAVDRTMNLDELNEHLHSLPDQPDAIPYVTSYYNRTWGFCLSENQRRRLKQGTYRAYIDARHFEGGITLGELIIPGESEQEILLSTYCCHPSMANNELSGPCLTTYLARWLQSEERHYTYRIIFVPEMIGSIAYLHDNMAEMKVRTIAGFNITCVGDQRTWSFLPSRHGNSLADRVARHVLEHATARFDEYTWLDRASDESNYCAPGIDLPVASVMRSKYGEYTEYHTSLDDLERVVTRRGLSESFALYQKMIELVENDCRPRTQVLGEPQLGRRGLYPSISKKGSARDVRVLLDLISWSDGDHSLLEIAELCKVPAWQLLPILDTLCESGVLERGRL